MSARSDEAVASARARRDLGVTRRSFLKEGATFAGGVAGASLLAACGASSSGAGTSSASAVPSIHPKVDGDISWLTWAQYVPPQIVSDFERHYGVKVTQSFMSTEEQYVQKLAAGEPFDLITTNNGYMPQTLAGGLVKAFNLAELKNHDQLLPYFQRPWWDAGRYRFTVPYAGGPTGILYRKDKDLKITGSWSDIFSNPHAAGHLYLLDAVGDTLGMALLNSGYYCNSGVAAQVDAARSALLAIKPHVASITTNLAPPVANGSAWLMEAWTTAALQGIQQSKDPNSIGFYVPREGPLMAWDTLSVGIHAKAPGTALLFMDWVLRPDNNAALAKYAALRTGAKGGQAGFGETIKKYPDFAYPDSLYYPYKNWKIAPTGARLQLWNQVWSQVTA
jgi:spermidine/putrescine transport system substrate-binding protein